LLGSASTAKLENAGIPVVYTLGEGFSHDAESAAHDYGMTEMRFIELAGYYWHIPADESRPIAIAYFDEIMDALVRPLTELEQNPPQLEPTSYQPVTIIEDSYPEAVEEFHRIFYENQWSDGLSLIPPTREAVDWMLTGTNRSPDEVIGIYPLKYGVATVELAAVNAVMAGANPEFFPVILAALDATSSSVAGMAMEDYDLTHPLGSLGGFEFAIWTSGPDVAKDLGQNYSERLWTYGNRGNATLGRALRLCWLNFGHTWPGINDMARQRSNPFVNYTFAEVPPELSPWEPYHVSHGFDPEDNVITVSTINGSLPTTYTGRTAYMEPPEERLLTAQATVERLVDTVKARRGPEITDFDPTVAAPSAHYVKYIFMISPDMAYDLYDLGFTDQLSLMEHIYEASLIPYEDLTADEIVRAQQRIDGTINETLHTADRIPPDRLQVFIDALQPGGKYPVLFSPQDIHLVVVGGPDDGKKVTGFSYMEHVYTWSSHESRAIEK